MVQNMENMAMDSIRTPHLPSTAYAPFKASVPVPKLSASLPPPKFPTQKEYGSRAQSFRTWPKGSAVKIKALVDSGFSYTGVKDRVQCFQCGSIMEKWQADDDVDHEHARNVPDCPFIRQKLGAEKVDMLSALSEVSAANYAGAAASPILEHSVTTEGQGHGLLVKGAQEYAQPISGFVHNPKPSGVRQPVKKRRPVAPRDIRARLDTAMSRKLMELGYKKNVLAQVIGERLAEAGDDFPTFMEYFNAVQNAERILTGGESGTLEEFYQKSVDRLAKPEPTIPQNTSEGPAAGNSTATASVRELESTQSNTPSNASESSLDTSLKRKKECNICMDAEADTVYMPCRHMCSCSTCAEKLAHCPICRRRIEHCIKVFVG